MKRILTILVLTGLLFAGCGGNEPYVEPTPGQAVFLNNCVGCHRGEGKNAMGPDYRVLQSTQTSDADKFRRFLRKPTSSMMPAFPENRLSDEDVALLYEYIQDVKSTGK